MPHGDTRLIESRVKEPGGQVVATNLDGLTRSVDMGRRRNDRGLRIIRRSRLMTVMTQLRERPGHYHYQSSGSIVHLLHLHRRSCPYSLAHAILAVNAQGGIWRLSAILPKCLWAKGYIRELKEDLLVLAQSTA